MDDSYAEHLWRVSVVGFIMLAVASLGMWGWTYSSYGNVPRAFWMAVEGKPADLPVGTKRFAAQVAQLLAKEPNVNVATKTVRSTAVTSLFLADTELRRTLYVSARSYDPIAEDVTSSLGDPPVVKGDTGRYALSGEFLEQLRIYRNSGGAEKLPLGRDEVRIQRTRQITNLLTTKNVLGFWLLANFLFGLLGLVRVSEHGTRVLIPTDWTLNEKEGKDGWVRLLILLWVPCFFLLAMVASRHSLMRVETFTKAEKDSLFQEIASLRRQLSESREETKRATPKAQESYDKILKLLGAQGQEVAKAMARGHHMWRTIRKMGRPQ